jgi:nicotinamidase-related amidase
VGGRKKQITNKERAMAAKGDYQDAESIYQKARITGRVGFGRKAAAAREKNLPIYFTTVFYKEDMSDAGVWWEKFPSIDTLKEGTRDTELDEALGRQPCETLIVKKYPSAFFGTPLVSHLVAAGVDTLIVTGATTSGCVRATVVDSLQYGFRTIVPEECVGDRAEAPHRANLFDMGAKYADVLPIEEVLAKIREM